MNADKWVAVIAGVALLILVFPAMRRIPMNEVLRNIVILLALFAAVGLFYRFILHPEEFEAPPAEPEAEVRLETDLL